jgi:hypothetical protein
VEARFERRRLPLEATDGSRRMAKKAQDDYIDLDSIEPRLSLLTRLVMDDARER